MGLPSRVVQLPLTALSLGLQAWEHSRGIREFALRRGNEALQIAAHTPLGRLLPQQIFNDGADEEAALVAAEAREASRPRAVPDPPKRPAPPAPKPAPVITDAAREVGAPGAVTQEVEELTEELHIPAPESRGELPIPDFDNISLGSLRARLRKMSLEQLVVLREWEQAHANRLPVVTTLDNRIAKLHEERTSASNGSGGAGGGSSAGGGTPAQSDVGAPGTDYPREAEQAERAAEDEGGTLRV